MNKVNAAINIIAAFTIPSLLPENAIEFKASNSLNPYSYWIQDGFLVLERILDTDSIKPVDASIGEIDHIAFNFYGGGDLDLANSYNKIYVDLIIKIIKVFKQLKEDTLKNDNTDVNKKMILIEGKSGTYTTDVVDVLKAVLKKYIDPQSIGKKPKPDPIELMLKGGNVLFVGDRALVGYDLILDSFLEDKSRGILGKYKTETYDDEYTVNKKVAEFNRVLESYEEEFKNQFAEITHVGKLDVIFIGSKEILLESINLDIDLFKTPGKPEAYKWIGEGGKIKHFSAQGIYHIDLFITAAGKDEFGYDRLVIGNPISPGDDYLPAFNFTKKVINKIADILVGSKFTIYRNPLPLTYIDHQEEDSTVIQRNWFFTSYNNCLVQFIESKSEKNFVWMPTYGSDFSNEFKDIKTTSSIAPRRIACGNWSYLREYDMENIRIWRSLGFKVEKLTNYLPLAEKRGAVRCISKVLSRKRKT